MFRVRHVQIDPADLMVALVFDSYLVRTLKEPDRFGMQQDGGAEGITKRRRPKRVESLDGVLGLLFHIVRSPRRQQRTLVIADIGVGAEIIAIGIDATLVMDIALKIVDRLGSSGRRDELEIVAVEPWAEEIRNVGLSLGREGGRRGDRAQQRDGQYVCSAHPPAPGHLKSSSLKGFARKATFVPANRNLLQPAAASRFGAAASAGYQFVKSLLAITLVLHV